MHSRCCKCLFCRGPRGPEGPPGDPGPTGPAGEDVLYDITYRDPPIIIKDIPFAWVNLLTLNATITTNNRRLLCHLDVAYRAHVLLGPNNPIKTSFRITVDGSQILTFSKTTFPIATLAFETVSFEAISALLAPGVHVVNLDWGTDAGTGPGIDTQVELNDGGDFFGNIARLTAEQVI